MGTHHAYETFPDQRALKALRGRFPANVRSVTHHGQSLLLPDLGTDKPVILRADPRAARPDVPADAAVIRDIDTPWNVAKHGVERAPVSLGRLTRAEREAFGRMAPEFAQYVLDMPIKFPGTEVRLPGALASVAPVVQRILDAEAALNPNYGAYYAYLSYHQGMVEPGARQREMPPHVDGFQGARWAEKQPANHSYLVSDALATTFFPGAFPIDRLDLARDDVYAEFARQLAAQGTPRTWTPEPHEIALMDAYCVHQGSVATERTFRTWLQVSWETRVFDRIGNTHNPLFAYDWEMVPRDLPAGIRPRLAA